MTMERFSIPVMPVKLTFWVMKLAVPVPSAPTVITGRSPP